MWMDKGREKKKAQECTIENTVLINRVSSHCTTRTEHMGSARSRSRGTGGKSQVLAASAQLRGWPAQLRGVASTARGGGQNRWRGGQHGRSPVLRWGHWHIQWPQCSNHDPSSAQTFSAPWASPPIHVSELLTLPTQRSACFWFYYITIFLFYHYCIAIFLFYHYMSIISLYVYRDHEFLKPEVLRTTEPSISLLPYLWSNPQINTNLPNSKYW